MRCSQSQPNQDSSYLKMQYVQYVPFNFQIQSSPSVIHVAGYAKAKSVMSNIHTMILPEKPCQTWAYCRSCAPRALPNRDRETVALQEVDTRPVLDSTKAGLLNGPQTPACGKASRLAVLGTTTSHLQKGQAQFCCALSSLIEINHLCNNKGWQAVKVSSKHGSEALGGCSLAHWYKLRKGLSALSSSIHSGTTELGFMYPGAPHLRQAWGWPKLPWLGSGGSKGISTAWSTPLLWASTGSAATKKPVSREVTMAFTRILQAQIISTPISSKVARKADPVSLLKTFNE